MTRGCLKEMKMPASFWGEVVRNSVYMLNRLPTRALIGQTPYEAWYNEKPDISHIRVFGCLAYMKTPSTHNQKLDDRSKKVVNLGRETGTKGYRLFDPKANHIQVSRDVVFEEGKTWPWDQTEEKESELVVKFSGVNEYEGEKESQTESGGDDQHDNFNDDDTTEGTSPRTPSSSSLLGTPS